jgi:DNA invertase Pin-like site-specific DNA recombinase
MANIGYARVSLTDQDLASQREALRAAGCTVIREEKATGISTSGREVLSTILDVLYAGDVLMVTRVDRLARSVRDLRDIMRTLKAKGASLKATEQPIDTATASGKAFVEMLEVVAELETKFRKERQLEGIAKARAKGAYKGGKRRLDRETVRAMHAAGHGPAAIAKALGCSRMSVYRALAEGRRLGPERRQATSGLECSRALAGVDEAPVHPGPPRLFRSAPLSSRRGSDRSSGVLRQLGAEGSNAPDARSPPRPK